MKRERENNPRRLTTARSSRRPWWTAEAATGAGVIPMARGKTSGSTDAKGRGGAACTSNWSEGERWQRNRRRIGARRRWREEEKEEHGCRCLAFIDEGDVTTLKASSRSRPRDGRAYRREEAPRRDRRQTASGEEETEEAAAGPVRLTPCPSVCSDCFFNQNRIFFSQPFSQNSIFQPVSAKIQQVKRGQSCSSPRVIFYLRINIKNLMVCNIWNFENKYMKLKTGLNFQFEKQF